MRFSSSFNFIRYLNENERYKVETNLSINIHNNTASLHQQHDIKRNPRVVLYTHIAQIMTHTTTVYIAAAADAYLTIMLLSILAYCKGKLRIKRCVYYLHPIKVDSYSLRKDCGEAFRLAFKFLGLMKSNYF